MNNSHCPIEDPKPEFRLLIINRSGNSTKTASGNLIRNRMQNPKYYTVGHKYEEINDFEKLISANQIPTLHKALTWRKSVIVEVNVCGYERTINYMKDVKGYSKDYDAVLVPIINSSFKLIEDSIGTIDDLISVGMPAHKIRVLFNRDPDSNESFEKMTDRLDELKITYNLEAQVKNHICYEELRRYKELHDPELKYNDITENTLDANEEELEKLEKLRVGEEPEDSRKKLINLVSLQRKVLAYKQHHDEVFKALFSDFTSR